MDRGDALRRQQVMCCTLYKFVIDTLVDRERAAQGPSERANHRYPQLTPEIMRGLSVKVKWEGLDGRIETPMIQNAHDLNLRDMLAVIGVMMMRKDSFFLWLLEIFSRGALAPVQVTPVAGSSSLSMARKRIRSASLPPAGNDAIRTRTYSGGAEPRGSRVTASGCGSRRSG